MEHLLSVEYRRKSKNNKLKLNTTIRQGLTLCLVFLWLEPVKNRNLKGRETTVAERVEITKECIQRNNNYSETALKYQVYGWVKKYRVMGEAGLEDCHGRRAGTLPSRMPEEELRDRIAQLEREKLGSQHIFGQNFKQQILAY